MLSLLLLAGMGGASWGADYGLPSNIQDGNILHCFNWPVKDIQTELANIAAAGFGSIQISPCQRGDVNAGSPWHDLYRPYDLAFKSSGYCSESDLQSLCEEAAKYGIKIIVDVVANHVDKTSGYHDTWWDSSGRVRWYGGIDYGDRNSITHGQLGDYGDVNSEDPQVIARGKAYVEKLKSLGVKGIRWDAAKHIGLPSEGCGFWTAVTSVPGMYHYGEILDNPGPNAGIIREYSDYMTVTDNRYSNGAARENGGIPFGYGGDWVVNQSVPDTKVIYWGESHDTYANDEWSNNVDQSVIDRAYAAFACRKGATALYLSRPNAKGFNNIKIGKGSTAFKSKHISAVNQFRNKMQGRADWCENEGNTFTVTRQDGGAVIVMKGSGNVSVKNGGGYCPAGTYTDLVSGGTFTVTSSTISGNVGSSGIAVIMKDGVTPNPNPDPDPTPDPNPGSVTITGDYNLAYSGDKTHVYYWADGNTPISWDAAPAMASAKGSDGNTYKVCKLPQGMTHVIFKDASGGQTDDLDYSSTHVMDDNGPTSTAVTFSGNPDPDPDPDPTPDPSVVKVYLEGLDACNIYVYSGANQMTAWDNAPAMTKDASTGYLVYALPDEFKTSNVIFKSGTQQYPEANAPGLAVNGKSMKFTWSSRAWEEYSGGDDPIPVKPVVKASPAGGSFSSTVSVTLSVTPSTATIYYTTDGSNPSTASSRYSSALTFDDTTTLKAMGVASDGTAGDIVTYMFTKSSAPGPQPQPANNLVTDYYKVNPDGKVGTFKTIDITGHPASNALSHWTEAELIAQGVARDICQAFKGTHERPVVDSYALYAAYDNDNLYLGVQYVYAVWDLYGEGKQPGESKPYNMDGKLCLAFDLDPNKSAKGITNENTSIWQDNVYTTFDNGVDAWWFGSTKPGSGNPGFFVPNANGICDYTDPNSCKVSKVAYGYADGLLPSITAIYGQDGFEYDPALLEGNTGFVDLRGEVDDTAHTFYEFKFPLSMMGITADYIRNTGIGVQVVDFYGGSAHSSLPYDPSFYDNVFEPYSRDKSSSKEKEDQEVVTYAPARVGKLLNGVPAGVVDIVEAAGEGEPEYYNLQGVRVLDPAPGVYIVRRGGVARKVVVR